MSSQKVRTTLNIEKDLMKAIKLAATEEEKKLRQKLLTKLLKKNLLNIQKPENKVRQPLSLVAGLFKAKESFDNV